jgi:hypothetical protein
MVLQLSDLYWFRQVVSRSSRNAGDDIHGRVTAREKDDWDLTFHVRSNELDHRQTIEPRHRDVGDDEIRQGRRGLLETVDSIASYQSVLAIAEHLNEGVRCVDLVVDDENEPPSRRRGY